MLWFTAPCKATDDTKLTCIICGKPDCEMEIMLKNKIQGMTCWKGIHTKCFEGHEEYMKWWAITDGSDAS